VGYSIYLLIIQVDAWDECVILQVVN